LLDDALGLFIFTLAKMVGANLPLRIDEIMCRPILVAEYPPDSVAVVYRDWIADLLPNGYNS